MAIDISKMVDMAFKVTEKAVSGAVKGISYVKVGTPIYDIVTGAYSGGTTVYSLSGIILETIEEDKEQGDSTYRKMKLLVRKSLVTFEASEADYLTISGEPTVWQVIQEEYDPTKTGFVILHCRAP